MASEIRPSSVAGKLLPEALEGYRAGVSGGSDGGGQDVADKVVFDSVMGTTRTPSFCPLMVSAAEERQRKVWLPRGSAIRGNPAAKNSRAGRPLTKGLDGPPRAANCRHPQVSGASDRSWPLGCQGGAGKDKAKAPEPVLQGLDPNVVASARTAGVSEENLKEMARILKLGPGRLGDRPRPQPSAAARDPLCEESSSESGSGDEAAW